MRATVIIDVRILDTFEGAEFVRELERKGSVNFVFAVENPKDKTGDDLLAHGAVISNSGKLDRFEFWRAVFEFVDNGRNEIVAIGAHYNHWQFVNEANKLDNPVPFQYVYNPENKRMVWL